MPDEMHPIATLTKASLSHGHALVPRIWWFEIRNVLVISERRGRRDARMGDRALGILRRLPIVLDDNMDEEALLSLARVYRLTVYDAAYLELARRENAPLATLDAMLASAARGANIDLIGEARE